MHLGASFLVRVKIGTRTILLLNDEIKKISIFRKKVNISAKISALKEFS
jgi:hypothetical protein